MTDPGPRRWTDLTAALTIGAGLVHASAAGTHAGDTTPAAEGGAGRCRSAVAPHATMVVVVEERAAVVVIEDDSNIAQLVELYLRDAGFGVHLAGDGTTGIDLVRARQPNLVILDIGLPGELDGLEVCRRLRATSRVPIVVLTARDTEVDRVVGLELGADDYVSKPFSPRELVARVRAVLRRAEGVGADSPSVIVIGLLEVDAGRREVRVGGTPVALAAREFALLLHLAEQQGLALSRQQLLDGVWGHDWYGDERTVDVHVRQLRKKLGDALPLATVRGTGYRLG